MYHLK